MVKPSKVKRTDGMVSQRKVSAFQVSEIPPTTPSCRTENARDKRLLLLDRVCMDRVCNSAERLEPAKPQRQDL